MKEFVPLFSWWKKMSSCWLLFFLKKIRESGASL
jgi:hypothetical protein